MKAEEVRGHLASLSVGRPKKIELGVYDNPKAVRNYFLVIAKNEGYIIRTQHNDGGVSVMLLGRKDPETKPVMAENNGYYRKNKTQDFGWPVARLTNVQDLIERMERVKLTPKPIAGGDYHTPFRKD